MKIIRDWHDDLIWCPSQCYLLVSDSKGDIYTVYLRWRWEDPWSCDLVEGDLLEDYDSKVKWVKDLFIQDNINFYFRDSELDKAKEKAIELSEQYLKK